MPGTAVRTLARERRLRHALRELRGVDTVHRFRPRHLLAVWAAVFLVSVVFWTLLGLAAYRALR